MDIYSKTAFVNTRHHDLMAEADAARLAATVTTPGPGAMIRATGERLARIVSEARAARVVRPLPHEAGTRG